MVTRKLRRWRDRGAAAVEFALVVGPLVFLIFGSIEFGLYVQARTLIENAAREGVRTASLVGSSDGSAAEGEVKNAAINALGSVSGTVDPPKVTCTTPASTCVFGSAKAGSVATVSITVHYTGITGLFPMLPNLMTASSTMRIE